MIITLKEGEKEAKIDATLFDIFVEIGENRFIFSTGKTQSQNLHRAIDYTLRFVQGKIDLRFFLEDMIKSEYGYLEI